MIETQHSSALKTWDVQAEQTEIRHNDIMTMSFAVTFRTLVSERAAHNKALKPCAIIHGKERLMDGSTKESCCPLQLAASSNLKPHNRNALLLRDRNRFCWILACYNDPQAWAVVQALALVLVLVAEVVPVDHHQ